MNLSEARDGIQTYLKSSKPWPIIVDLQRKQELLELIDFFKVGNNKFLLAETLCNQDGFLKLEELYAAISSNQGNTFVTELTGFLKVLGAKKTKATLKTLITKNISGHVVILTYQCRKLLDFSDPRIMENRQILIVDNSPDPVSEIYFVDPALSDAFPSTYQGLQRIGHAVENCKQEDVYIATKTIKTFFEESEYHIIQLNNSYDILCERDPRTNMVQKHYGTPEQWNYALQIMGKTGNWSTVFEECFGSEQMLSKNLQGYMRYDEKKQWLYFLALVMNGAKDNDYLQMVTNSTVDYRELPRALFRVILTVDRSDERFSDLYRQRKALLHQMKDTLPEIMDYCKYVSVKGENAVYYLTDNSKPEKERIIAWLDRYGEKYSSEELVRILDMLYHDLAAYLKKYNYRNSLLDSYFDRYKYQKVVNRILPSFEMVVDEQATKMDFVTILKPRASIVDKLDVRESRAFFTDAMGVEYLSFIQEKCTEYGLALSIKCARCELPSLTSFNKEFVDVLKAKGCQVSDIKEIDEIKHHGEDSFDYEKEKTPLYLIRELEIIDGLLTKIRAGIVGGQYEKAVIISDHGASRLAVLHETENIWSMATQGEHSGRCCKVSEIDEKPDYAIEENGYWVLANYDRFKGSRRANVEVHGGASIEEVAVPIIEITQKTGNVEASIIDEDRVIMLGAKQHAVIRLYVGLKSNDVSIMMDGKFYDAVQTEDDFVYRVDLPECSRKGKYSFDILHNNDVLATGQQFEIKKKGMSEVSLFD